MSALTRLRSLAESLNSPQSKRRDTMAGVLYEARREVAEILAEMEKLRAGVIAECAKCVPTNWCDSLLTGPNAPKGPLGNREVEQLLCGIQDRIRALAVKTDGGRT